MRYYGKSHGKAVGSSAKKAKAQRDKESGLSYPYKMGRTPARIQKMKEKFYV